MEFQALPEDCIAAILSRTTPVDVCRLSSVSKIFRSAAESDAVWARFLPSDSHFSSILSQSPSLADAPSKKALYLALSDRPIIIDQGKQSFQLERKSGKKCYMLGARALSIVWGDTAMYWKWITMPDSRFLSRVNLESALPSATKNQLVFTAIFSSAKYGGETLKSKLVKKDWPVCVPCGVLGHTINKCFKIHGYIPSGSNPNLDIQSN